MGYVEPAYHPAPFDTRVIAGAPPQYEKVVYQVNERNVKKTLEKLRKSYEIDNLAASLTEPTIMPKSSQRRRWNQDPKQNGNADVFQTSLMFPPIMIKSASDAYQSTDTTDDQGFLEGLIAPPIIPVTRRHSNCEIDGIFNINSNTSQDITQIRADRIGRTGSSISSIIGDATTVRASTSHVAREEKTDSRASQSNLNRIKAFIAVN